MFNLSLRQKKLIKRTAIYTIMILAIGLIVAFTVFTIMGYRFDSGNGHIEQYALLQFSSTPSGATVAVDGKIVSSKTPNKFTVSAGKHEVKMSLSGYKTWDKTVNIKSGTLEWLNYALLVPNKLTVEPVASYGSLNLSLASPNGHYMLIQGNPSVPSFDLVDLSADIIKTTKLTIATDVYGGSTATDMLHNFQIYKWDYGERYVTIKHTFNDKSEWLVLDTQDDKSTKNITRLFDFSITSIEFSGTGGNIFYALGSGDIRKINLSDGTISKPLVSGVSSFSRYGSNIITYIGNSLTIAGQQVVGLYRDGDEKPHILRAIKDNNSPVSVATARYFNEDYVAISVGKKVDILGGSYPSVSNDTSSLKLINSFMSGNNVQNLNFSPTGEYVFAQSDADFTSYDLEYQLLSSSSIAGYGSISPLRWLNDNYIWSDRGGNLTIREFDGANVHTINSVQAGQSITLANNGRYLYSIDKTAVGYQLQRVRMILP